MTPCRMSMPRTVVGRKHAGTAAHATVLLCFGPDEVCVEVRDNGRSGDGYGTGHGLVRTGFWMILDAQPDIQVVAEAADGAAAITAVDHHAPHVLLMDIRMPGMDGLQATRILTARPHAPHVLVLTTFDTDEYIYDALRSGAAGFLLKTAPARRLRPRPGPGVPVEVATLTERELEVLRAIGRGLSNTQIAAELVVTEATVKTHINRLFTKLNLRDRVQAVVLAYESGLIQPGETRPPS